jgi:protein TonB
MRRPQSLAPHAVEDRLRRRDSRRFALAFAGAVLLHASTALSLTFWQPAEPVAPPGEMVITIDLAPAVMSTATAQNAGEAVESAPQKETPPEPPAPTPEEEVVEELPEPTPEPAKEEIIDPPKAEKAAVVLSPKKKQAKKKKEAPKPVAPSQAATASNTAKAQVGGTGASAKPSELADYIGRVRALLDRRKRYPASAGGVSGTSGLRFTVNRSGHVTGWTLTRSSGNAALDGATRAMIQGASFPPIPEGLPASLTVGVPVRFSTN